MAKVCFIGLGNMGYPMAGWLAKKKHQVTVYNRTSQKAKKWLKNYTGKIEKTPALAAKDADFVISCVGNDDDVRSVILAKDGALSTIKEKAILIDHTTASANLAKELEQLCLKKKVGFLDAPVSGGQLGAEKGILTTMVGGRKATFKKSQKIMECYSQKIALMGPAGHGQLTKMINQICIAGLVQALSEAINFGDKAGVNLKKAIQVIAKGAAQSWQLENRSKTMIEGNFDFGFALDWMRKDLAICFAEAKKHSANLPITKQVDKLYKQLQENGKGRWDTSALIENLRQKI